MDELILKELNRKLKQKEYARNYYKLNKENRKSYRLENKDKIRKQRKEYRTLNKDTIKESRKEYDLLNKDKKKEYQKKYDVANKDKIKERKRKYNLKNNDKVRKHQKEYYLKNKDKIRKHQKEYKNNREKTDPIFKFKRNLRNLIRNSITRYGFTKKSKTFKIVGCSFEEAILHFQNRFTDGMTLANHGEWHIDHIIPLSTASTEEEVIKLNHISNLQPLWADDNLSKSDKLDWTKNN